MPSTTVSRGRSTPRMASAMLVGLLFATAVLFAFPTNAAPTCEDNPVFVYRKGKALKDGTDKNCDWIKSLPMRKRDRICRRKDKNNNNNNGAGKRIKKICPEACGGCKEKKNICPKSFNDPDSGRKNSEGGDCSKYEPGLSCDYNYEYTGGCGAEAPIICNPIDTYTCGDEDSTWSKSSFERFPCIVKTFLPSGETCDPNQCSLEPPEQGSRCDAAQVYLSCPYGYQYTGCTFQNGFSCTATDYYVCNENLIWDFVQLQMLPCFDESPNSAQGMTCEPCPKVEPEGICPPEKPKGGELCDLEKGTTCRYDFEVTGCSPEEMQCTSLSFFSCFDGEWAEAVADPRPCPPTDKSCPDSKPESGTRCIRDGYNVGMSCNYEFADLSCDEDIEICSATEFYSCSETRGWMVAINDFSCFPETPPGFMDRCDPSVPSKCTPEEPEMGSKCSGIGINCDYGYAYTGCTAEEATCSATKLYTCGLDGTWSLALPDPIDCGETNPEPPIGDTCDPLQCPVMLPESGSSCDAKQASLRCPYYEYIGCTYEDGFSCVETASSFCSADLIWDVVMMIPLPCMDPDVNSAQGMTCEPCPKVEPEGICPPEKPKGGELCDLEKGTTCRYDFEVTGCSPEEMQCTSLSFFSCFDGEWAEAVADPRPCPLTLP